jgi:hypothetical protein
VRLIQYYLLVHSVVFGFAAAASPLSVSDLADQALAIIGAHVPNSSHKCAGCHRLDAAKLRTWFDITGKASNDCLGPWAAGHSVASAEAALACLSVNNSVPYRFAPKKLGLWAARVNGPDFEEIFNLRYGQEAEHELNRFRQATFMPRSGAPGFTDEQWALVREYVDRGGPLLEEKLSVPVRQEERNFSVSFTLEGLSFPVGDDRTIDLRFGDSKKFMATDEFGRRCLMDGGELIPFLRDGKTMWRLEGTNEGGPMCRNGMTFKVENGRFLRVDHGFPGIFKYYATQSCTVGEEKRALSDDEAQMIADCFLKRDKWATVKALYDWYMNTPEIKYPLREACTTQVLKHAGLTVECSNGFKRLGENSGFLDLVVLEKGNHVIRGAGSQASNYILHPDFSGEIDLRGHSYVFHLPRHKCSSPDVFRGCVSMIKE